MSFSSVFRRAAVAPASAVRAFSTTTPRPLAKITIIGNLADTPEVHPTSNGREILRYAVASNSGRGDNRKTSWFRITSFAEGAQRDYLMNLPKGATVYVEGDASMNTFTDSSGQNRTNFSVVQRTLEVLRRPQAPEQGE
ncbi:ssDNA binding protein [Fusarium heterosporum]|uniref:SsDNA binding protein n=1 Tax=Fusarium heterosporum TaxID=42747 RepID=A0A8H5WQV6_FUSHE|nr:ssDNA binding protein [Fusarium heterosporum]